MLVPFYRLFPDPRTLIVLQNIVFWWVIPAAYGLVRSESRSAGVGAVGRGAGAVDAALLAAGVERLPRAATGGTLRALGRPGRARADPSGGPALGIAGMLACRQEFAVDRRDVRYPAAAAAGIAWHDPPLAAGAWC